jgi:hypothetical protein
MYVLYFIAGDNASALLGRHNSEREEMICGYLVLLSITEIAGKKRKCSSEWSGIARQYHQGDRPSLNHNKSKNKEVKCGMQKKEKPGVNPHSSLSVDLSVVHDHIQPGNCRSPQRRTPR